MSFKSPMASSRPKCNTMREDDGQLITEDDALNATPVFSYSTHDFLYQVDPIKGIAPIPVSKFEEELCGRWEQAKDEKAMNYRLNLIYKHLPGKYGLAAQLNIERAQLRRKPTPIRSMTDQFDHRRFNYTKIKFKEILFDMRCSDDPLTNDPIDRHLVLVNASPIEKSHSLAVPCVQKCLTQIPTKESVLLGMHLMLLAGSCRFHVVFNSLLAYASVNHLHMHMYYWPFVSDIVKKPVTPLFGCVHLLSAPNPWYTPAFVLQLNGKHMLKALMSDASFVLSYLCEHNIAHNIFMARAPPIATPPGEHMTKHWLVTMYIYPRRSIHAYRFFESMTEEGVKRIMNDEASLPDEEFEQLLNGIKIQYQTKLKHI